MAIEIELKFIALPKAIDALPAFLATLHGVLQPQAAQQLTNIYYDTQQRLLRQHDLGLRIRGCDGRYEMTLKGGSQGVTGLHQRAEYNIDLSEAKLNLSLLPAEFLPKTIDIKQLESDLVPLFSTHFQRQRWWIHYQQSEIEIALDCGEICAGEQREALHEIELELKQGHTADLLALAQQLTQLGHIRLAGQSKAARGYRLIQGSVPESIHPLTVLSVARKASVEQGLECSLQYALSYWQRHEELLFLNDALPSASADYSTIRLALAMVRQIWQIFSGDIPRKASAELREKLNGVEQLLQQTDRITEVIYQPHYQQAKLLLITWLLNKQWNLSIKQKDKGVLQGSFKRFADIMLGRYGAELKTAFTYPLSEVEYQDQLPRLQRALLSFYLLSGAYQQGSDKIACDGYIQAWQALQSAIQDQLSLKYLDELCATALAQRIYWLHGGSVNNPLKQKQ